MAEDKAENPANDANEKLEKVAGIAGAQTKNIKSVIDNLKHGKEPDWKTIVDLSFATADIAGVCDPRIGVAVNGIKIVKSVLDVIIDHDEQKEEIDPLKQFQTSMKIAFNSNDCAEIKSNLDTLSIELVIWMIELEKLNRDDCVLYLCDADHAESGTGKYIKETSETTEYIHTGQVEINQDIVSQLEKWYNKDQVINAMENVKNPNDINAVNNYLDANANQGDYVAMIKLDRKTLIGRIKNIYDKYKTYKPRIDSKLVKVANDLSEEKGQDKATKNEAQEKVQQLCKLMHMVFYRNTVYNLIGSIVGDTTKTDELSHLDSQSQIQSFLTLQNKLIVDRFEFLWRPKVRNRVLVASFYDLHMESRQIIEIFQRIKKNSALFHDPQIDFGRKMFHLHSLYDNHYLTMKGNPWSAVGVGLLAASYLFMAMTPKLALDATMSAGEIVRSQSAKTRDNILQMKPVLDENRKKQIGCYYIHFGDNMYLCKNTLYGGGQLADTQVVTRGSIDVDNDDSYVHKFIIFKVWDKDDEFYLFSKCGDTERFMYYSMNWSTSVGVYFSNHSDIDGGSDCKKWYWKVEQFDPQSIQQKVHD
eukprot:272199_1